MPALGYAIKYCLLSAWLAHLQHLLDTAHAFLNSVAMKLSTSKTKVLICEAAPDIALVRTARRGAAWAAAPQSIWTCGGLLLERMAKYHFLGTCSSWLLALRRQPASARGASTLPAGTASASSSAACLLA